MSKRHILGTASVEEKQEGTPLACDLENAKRYWRNFCQLEWRDKFNVAFAAVLGIGLVLVLSPILLVSWICLQLAKQGFKRSASLEMKSPQSRL